MIGHIRSFDIDGPWGKGSVWSHLTCVPRGRTSRITDIGDEIAGDNIQGRGVYMRAAGTRLHIAIAGAIAYHLANMCEVPVNPGYQPHKTM